MSNAKLVHQSARRSSAFVLALLALMLVLELVVVPIALAQPVGVDKNQINSNLDSFISELIDDASQRLKKSKSGRHLKSSLRFGRRSDPTFNPSELEEENSPYQVPFSLD